MNMPMFIVIFLMLCIIAQPHICVKPQPIPSTEVPSESASVDHKATIFSRINNAGNCTAYESLKSDQNYRQLEEYCERPPGTPRANGYVSYEVILCMVLYDAAHRVCGVGRREVTKDITNLSAGFSCDAMIKGVREAFDESIKIWVELFKAKLGHIPACERACVQDKTISPVCEYIWKANTLTNQASVSSTISADISENPQVNSKGNGKTNKAMASNDNLSSAAGTSLSNGSQNTQQVDHKKTPTNKSTFHQDGDLDEAYGNSTQSSSANDVKNVKEQAHAKDGKMQNDFKKQAPATVNTGHNDAKKQPYTTGGNIQNDINNRAHDTHSNVQNVTKKQEHATDSSNVQNVTKKQEHATDSSNHSAEVTPHNGQVLPVHSEHTPEAGKYDESIGKSISSDSKSNTALQPANKSSAGVYTSNADMENKNIGDLVMPTDDDDVEDNFTSVEGDLEEEERNSDQEKQSKKSSVQTETHQEEADTDSTAQFNQLGDAAYSHFYGYFMTMVVICIIGYLVFHNKQKILALALEGRSRRGTRRRPNTSAYRKLDSNLEEAVTSTGSTSVTHVIY